MHKLIFELLQSLLALTMHVFVNHLAHVFRYVDNLVIDIRYGWTLVVGIGHLKFLLLSFFLHIVMLVSVEQLQVLCDVDARLLQLLFVLPNRVDELHRPFLTNLLLLDVERVLFEEIPLNVLHNSVNILYGHFLLLAIRIAFAKAALSKTMGSFVLSLLQLFAFQLKFASLIHHLLKLTVDVYLARV